MVPFRLVIFRLTVNMSADQQVHGPITAEYTEDDKDPKQMRFQVMIQKKSDGKTDPDGDQHGDPHLQDQKQRFQNLPFLLHGSPSTQSKNPASPHNYVIII